MKTRSLLPNSCAETYTPKQTKGGTLETRWIEAIDAHGLFYLRSSGPHTGVPILLATHHNGYSCDTLANRIASCDAGRALAQAQYIADCGGTRCSDSRIAGIIANEF